MSDALYKLSTEQLEQFQREGYIIIPGLFKPEEVADIEVEFERLSHIPVPGYFEPDLNADNTDPLKRYPRIMHPHRFNDKAMQYMLHPDVLNVLEQLYGEPALACQSMFYFKPPGARGQALHQDNFYLLVEPGNCIAAWTAIDAADQENGGLLVVPQTSDHAIVCPETADSKESFTSHFVKPPEGKKAVPATMGKGDVLFFNGNLIHGSYRNKTKDRFRRAFICHYASESTTKIGQHYMPLFRADGTAIELESNPDSGPCGIEFEVAYPH